MRDKKKKTIYCKFIVKPLQKSNPFFIFQTITKYTNRFTELK